MASPLSELRSEPTKASLDNILEWLRDKFGDTGHPLLHVRDLNAGQGGTFTQGSWQTRVLQTIPTNEITGASLASNQITLPAGTYFCIAWAGAVDVDQHQTRLWDTTGAAELIRGGTAFARSGSGGGTTNSWVIGRFTLSVESALELRHRCATSQATNGYGVDVTWADNIYSEVMIWQLSL